jgi:hypothetical protein
VTVAPKADIPDVLVPAVPIAICAAFKSFTSVQAVPLYCSVFAILPGLAPPKINPAVFVPTPPKYLLPVFVAPPDDHVPTGAPPDLIALNCPVGEL